MSGRYSGGAIAGRLMYTVHRALFSHYMLFNVISQTMKHEYIAYNIVMSPNTNSTTEQQCACNIQLGSQSIAVPCSARFVNIGPTVRPSSANASND